MQSVFRSRPGAAVLSTSTSKEDIDIYVFKVLSDPGREGFAMRLIQAAQQVEEWEVEDAASYVASVSCLIFPNLLGVLTEAVGINAQVIEVDCLADDFNPSCWTDKGPDTAPGHVSHRNMAARDTQLFGTLTPNDSVADVSPEVVGGRWGIEMYPIGKNVSRANLTGYVNNRPKAIFDKYSLSENRRALFSGVFAPTLRALEAVSLCWNTYPALRQTLGGEWVGWVGVPAGRSQNAFKVTFELTNGSGFSGAALILDLLTAYPELRNFSLLKAQIAEFDRGMEEFYRLPIDRRGFFKVLYGDRVKMFRAINRGELVAVAIFHGRNTSPSVNRFMDTTAFVEFGGKVNDYLASIGKPQIEGITAAQTSSPVQPL